MGGSRVLHSAFMALAMGLALAGCGEDPPEPEAIRTEIPESVADDAPPPPEMGTPPAGDGMNIMDDAAADVLGGAIGGEADAAIDGIDKAGLSNPADTAIGAAMDSATDQGLAEGQPDDARPVDAPDDVVAVEDATEDDAAPDDVSPV